MKKVLLKSLLFCIPLVTVLGLWEYGLGKVENSYSKKKKQLESSLKTIEFLVLGNSQALNGVNPSVFSRPGYNLANSAQPLYYDEKFVSGYVDKMPSLKYVFITISDFSLWFKLTESDDHWRCCFYSQFWGITEPSLKWYETEVSSKIMLYSPFTAAQYAFKGFNVDLADDIEGTGWRKSGEFHKEKMTDANASDRLEMHEGLCHDECLHDNLLYLDSIMYLLRKHSVKPVIITAPLSPVYLKYVNRKRMHINDSILHSISIKYHCAYVNYWCDTTFKITDFGDVYHLNKVGATKWSKMLNQLISDSTARKY